MPEAHEPLDPGWTAQYCVVGPRVNEFMASSAPAATRTSSHGARFAILIYWPGAKKKAFPRTRRAATDALLPLPFAQVGRSGAQI